MASGRGGSSTRSPIETGQIGPSASTLVSLGRSTLMRTAWPSRVRVTVALRTDPIAWVTSFDTSIGALAENTRDTARSLGSDRARRDRGGLWGQSFGGLARRCERERRRRRRVFAGDLGWTG